MHLNTKKRDYMRKFFILLSLFFPLLLTSCIDSPLPKGKYDYSEFCRNRSDCRKKARAFCAKQGKIPKPYVYYYEYWTDVGEHWAYLGIIRKTTYAAYFNCK